MRICLGKMTSLGQIGDVSIGQGFASSSLAKSKASEKGEKAGSKLTFSIVAVARLLKRTIRFLNAVAAANSRSRSTANILGPSKSCLPPGSGGNLCLDFVGVGYQLS